MDVTTGAVIIAGLKYVGTPSAQLVADFISRVLAPAGDALGSGLAHPILEWQKRRVERATQLVTGAAAKVEEAGVEPRPVPARLLMPLLEKGSLEEDAELQDHWSWLLAHAAMEPDRVPPSYVAILSELSPRDAGILFWLADKDRSADTDPLRQQLPGLENPATFLVTMQNLARLNLVQATLAPDVVAENQLVLKTAAEPVYKFAGLTILGMDFLNACGLQEIWREQGRSPL